MIAAAAGRKRHPPVLMACGVLTSTAAIVIGSIALLFFLAWRKDVSLRHYASAQLAAESFSSIEDREMAEVLADENHDRARSLAENARSLSGFFLVRKADYYGNLRKLINPQLESLKHPLPVTPENFAGIWVKEDSSGWIYYNCGQNRKYAGGFIAKGHRHTVQHPWAGTWQLQGQSVIWTDGAGPDPDPIVRLCKQDLVLREADGSLTMLLRADDFAVHHYYRSGSWWIHLDDGWRPGIVLAPIKPLIRSVSMGTKGRAIVENVDRVLELLGRAYADEWLAYYQYWIGAKVATGPMKEAVMAELLQHAADELRHAGLVADRILQLDGTPALEPKLWYKLSNCGYDAPTDPYVTKLLEQNIKGEQCAITTYHAMLKETRDADPVTYNMVLTILQDEVEHEEDLQALEEDIKVMFGRAGKRR